MEIGGFALRDIVIVVSGLAAVYLVYMLLRLLQVGRRKAAAEDPSAAPAAPPESANDEARPIPARKSAAEPPLVLARPPERAPAPSFDSELERSHQDTDARQLREEVGRLRLELAELREEFDRMTATRHVSPQYSDAMTMAKRGLTAQDVADRCGISLGEAELIWALSRGPMNFDQEDNHGGEPQRKHARAA